MLAAARQFPLHKTAVRSVVCAVGIPAQYFALASFLFLGVLQPARDWPTLLAVLGCATCGVWLGERLHAHLSTSAATWGLLVFLAAVAVELLSADIRVRSATVLVLLAAVGCAVCDPKAASASRILRRCRCRCTQWAPV